jgi:hypothetical protein
MIPVANYHEIYTVIDSTKTINLIFFFDDLLLFFLRNYIYDNESCYNLVCPVKQTLGYMTCYKDLNHLIAQVQSGMTCNLRWDHELEIDIGQIETNLIPFPNINKVTLAFLKYLN